MEGTQMADTTDTTSEPGFADLLELDLDRPAAKAAVAPVPYDTAPQLDLCDDVKHPKCIDCGAEGAVNDEGVCRACYEDRAVVPTSAQPAQDFAGVLADSAANAGAVSSGSLNEGARRYVGFNSAEGYVQALANGVKAETAEQYKNILVSSYGYTREAVNQLPVNLIVGSALPVGAGVQLHDGDTDAAVAAIKAHSAAIKAAKARQANGTPDGLKIIADDDTSRVRLTHGNVVAGAVAEGNGILTHWNGEKSLTLAKIRELAATAEIPDAWLPKAKSAETQANHAVNAVAREFKFVATREKKTHKDAGAAYDARWRIADPSTAGTDAGESAGSIVTVVTLNEGTLTFAGSDEIATKVAAVFADLTSREVLQAGHVTTWLGGVLRDHLGGVKYGGCWYVPVATRGAAEKIIAAFAPAWGTDWMDPPTPIATSEQLARGIAKGLASEVDDTLRELAKDGSKCVGGKVGEKAAITYLRRFKDHGAKALAFGHLLGETMVKEVKAKIAKATEELDGLIDDGLGTVKRFELIWEELERDLLKDAAKAEAAGEAVAS
jgi:hypothetical protein